MTASATALVAHATWRLLHPAERQPFLDGPRAAPLPRLYYVTRDGWRAPLLHLEARPGGSGEPVLLLHSLLLEPGAYRYGRRPGLADALSKAGFSVYFFQHRLDREAFAPPGAPPGSFDDIVRMDFGAAVARVCEHSGHKRVHVVGHGFGGQVAVAAAGWLGGDGVATVVTLSCAVRFARPRSGVAVLSEISRWLPLRYRVPASTLLRLAAPGLGAEDLATVRVAAASTSAAVSPRVRGAFVHHVNDLPVPLLRQVARWYAQGTLTDASGALDYLEATAGLSTPLLAVVSEGDELCPASNADVLLDAWGSPDTTAIRVPDRFGPLDLLFSEPAEEAVFGPIVEWLHARRRATWQVAA